MKATALKEIPYEEILNQEKIDYLTSLGKLKPLFMPQLVKTFTKCANEILRDLDLESNEAKDFFHLGHKLKGMCGNIGATKLENIALTIETAGQKGDIKGIKLLIQEARDAFVATEESLLQLISNP